MLDLYSSYCQVQPHVRKRGSSFQCNKITRRAGGYPTINSNGHQGYGPQEEQGIPRQREEYDNRRNNMHSQQSLSQLSGVGEGRCVAKAVGEHSNGGNRQAAPLVINPTRSNQQRYTILVTGAGEDTKLKFSIEPKPGEDAFQQWKDAMKAVARLPVGIPDAFRKKVWLALAEHYINQQKFDWDRIRALSFNERSNPDDNTLGLQIVKDLHRTGCDRFCTETDQAILKRVLLAYARWNKRVGYCQGFNVLAALILQVTERNEEDALKIMIFLVDHVLPESYYAQNLQALSVDMAVFRDLLKLRSPDLAEHLELLQRQASNVLISSRTPNSSSNSSKSYNSAASGYEPPLTNVFTMQWFLTLFATCLPADIVLKVWDAVLLEGSEVLLRVALVCWDKLAERIRRVETADQFYSLMGRLTQDLADGKVFSGSEPLSTMYSLTCFPYPGLAELREKYTYNITPFSSSLPSSYLASSSVASPKANGKTLAKSRNKLHNDDENADDLEDPSSGNALGCFATFGLFGGKGLSQASLTATSSMSSIDISDVSPGTVAANSSSSFSSTGVFPGTYRERMSTNLSALAAQYQKIQCRQKKASLLFSSSSSSNSKSSRSTHSHDEDRGMIGLLGQPGGVMNHLFLGHKIQEQRQRKVNHHRISIPSSSDDLQQPDSRSLCSPSPSDSITRSTRVSYNRGGLESPEASLSNNIHPLSVTDSLSHLEAMENHLETSCNSSNLQSSTLNPSITAKIVAKMTERTCSMISNATSNEKRKLYSPPAFSHPTSHQSFDDNDNDSPHNLTTPPPPLHTSLSTPIFPENRLSQESLSSSSANEVLPDDHLTIILQEEPPGSPAPDDQMAQLTSGLKHLPFPKRPMLHRINFGSQFGLYHAMTTSPMLRSNLNACLVQSLHSSCQN